MDTIDTSLCHTLDCTACLTLNASISERVLALQHSALAQRTHYFAGRFENIYIDAQHFPGLQTILDTALAHAANLLALPQQTLKLGFWFNIMHSGDVTQPHSHDDHDELLSGTYYLQVPPGSGALILQLPDGMRTLTPVAGRFVFFHPAVEHEVLAHQADTPRISIGFNIGEALSH